MMISIVVPVYFYNEFVINMFRSVFQQTYADFELVIVVNGVTLSEYQSISDSILSLPYVCDHNIKIIYTPIGAANNARKLGLSVCSGEFVMFIDSDDQLVKETN